LRGLLFPICDGNHPFEASPCPSRARNDPQSCGESPVKKKGLGCPICMWTLAHPLAAGGFLILPARGPVHIVREVGMLMSECDRLCKGSDDSKVSICHMEPVPARHRYGLFRFHVKLHESTLKEPERRKQVNPIERARNCTWALGMRIPSNKQGAEEGTLENDWLDKALFLARKTEMRRSLKI